MKNSQNRLGRGLGGLISKGLEKNKEALDEQEANGSTQDNLIKEIEVNLIHSNPFQPRKDFRDNQIEELASSIESEGLLQPIVVRLIDDNYQLIAGERRLRAYKFLNRKKIQCRVIEASDASSATLALIENLQREDLNPIDEALGYASLLRDFDLTQEEVSDRIGKNRATIANSLRLLSLSEEIKGFLSRRLLTVGHAKVLLSLKDEMSREHLARKIIESNISVRDSEKFVKKVNKGTNTKVIKVDNDDVNIAINDLEKKIEKHFNTIVSIKHGKKKGKLIFDYYGNEDLDRLLDLFGINSN